MHPKWSFVNVTDDITNDVICEFVTGEAVRQLPASFGEQHLC